MDRSPAAPPALDPEPAAASPESGREPATPAGSVRAQPRPSPRPAPDAPAAAPTLQDATPQAAPGKPIETTPPPEAAARTVPPPATPHDAAPRAAGTDTGATAPLPAPATPHDVTPPTATPPARPTSPASPARQIAPVLVAVAIPGGTARLSVTLEPAELGRVEISVERSGEATQVQVLAERPETLALLQRDQRELDRALGQAGIGAEGRTLSFSLADRGGDGAGARQGRGDHASSGGGPATPAQPDPPPRRLLSLLDLAV
jgi:Meckel syndrome type 1 protein